MFFCQGQHANLPEEYDAYYVITSNEGALDSVSAVLEVTVIAPASSIVLNFDF